MFMQGSTSTEVPKNFVQREFTVVEENAIYYASGYVVRKELKKYLIKHMMIKELHWQVRLME